MSFYGRVVVPRMIDLVMRNAGATERRAVLIPQAKGAVLEVGIGSGLNLPFYGAAVERLTGVDPSPELLAKTRAKLPSLRFPVELVCRSAEALPASDASVDTVVTTWTLCSIPDPLAALREMKRVLKPGGRLLFVEHGFCPDGSVHVWQDRLNPVWRRISGGCNLNRKIDELLPAAGWTIATLTRDHLPGPRMMTHTYQGSAV